MPDIKNPWAWTLARPGVTPDAPIVVEDYIAEGETKAAREAQLAKEEELLRIIFFYEQQTHEEQPARMEAAGEEKRQYTEEEISAALTNVLPAPDPESKTQSLKERLATLAYTNLLILESDLGLRPFDSPGKSAPKGKRRVSHVNVARGNTGSMLFAEKDFPTALELNEKYAIGNNQIIFIRLKAIGGLPAGLIPRSEFGL